MFAGMLFYGNKYWGITEANYLLVLLHIGTGYLGPSIWLADVAAMLDIKLPFTLRVNDCLLVFIAFFAISYSLAAFYRVLNVDQVGLHTRLLQTLLLGFFVDNPWLAKCMLSSGVHLCIALLLVCSMLKEHDMMLAGSNDSNCRAMSKDFVSTLDLEYDVMQL